MCLSIYQFVCVFPAVSLTLPRLQMLQDNRQAQDTEWMARREAMRERMPPHFSNDDLQKKLEEVGKVGGV